MFTVQGQTLVPAIHHACDITCDKDSAHLCTVCYVFLLLRGGERKDFVTCIYLLFIKVIYIYIMYVFILFISHGTSPLCIGSPAVKYCYHQGILWNFLPWRFSRKIEQVILQAVGFPDSGQLVE